MFRSLLTKIQSLLWRVANGRRSISRADEFVPSLENKNPWQGTLKRLETHRRTSEESKSKEVKAFVDQLSQGITAPRAEKNKERRRADDTVQDMKAWWGESVATWDTLNGKNLVSDDQRRTGRQKIRWFQ